MRKHIILDITLTPVDTFPSVSGGLCGQKSPLGAGTPGGLFCCIVPKPVLYWWRCPSPFWEQKEVSCMAQILTNIIVAVVAQVIADRLCKWLDSYRKGK